MFSTWKYCTRFFPLSACITFLDQATRKRNTEMKKGGKKWEKGDAKHAKIVHCTKLFSSFSWSDRKCIETFPYVFIYYIYSFYSLSSHFKAEKKEKKNEKWKISSNVYNYSKQARVLLLEVRNRVSNRRFSSLYRCLSENNFVPHLIFCA